MKGFPREFLHNLPQWFSRDNKINAVDRLLVSLIFKGNLQILGGKDNNDVYPYTHHSAHSSSLLDLFISRDKIDVFSEVAVHLGEESDHQPVRVTLQGHSDGRCNREMAP